MHKITRFAGTLIFILVACTANAQFVNYGTDPAHYRWNIVTTDHYKLIYPLGNDTMAYRYARLLETYHPYVQNTIGRSDKRNFPVVLHPGNMLSNGLVAWAPRRMELITTPSSDLYAQSWDRQLVVHESRHIFQTRKLNHGIFKPLHFLIGEQSSGISAFFVPTWFFEGDAVTTETALSGSGRGRLPEFNMIYRAQMMSGKFYSFDKWFLGSYKHHTGSKYALGYNITSYARHQYGADIWDKITETYVKRIYAIPPFANAIKRHTGISKMQLYEDTYSFLGKEWKEMENAYQQSGFRADYITPPAKDYTTYRYPQVVNDSAIIAIKTSLNDINVLVSLHAESEKTLTHLGSINSRIILNNGRVYWTENVSGLRWTHENYSVLKYYELNTGKVRTVSRRQRFQSPAISNDGATVALSEVSETGENIVLLVEAETGNRIESYPVPDNAFAKEIVYTNTNNLAVAAIADNGITIWQLDISDGSWEVLLEPTFANIASLSWSDGKLLFESGVNGTNNIYSLEPGTGMAYRLTTARFGAFTPILANGKLIFSDYQADGYRLASVPVDKLQKEPTNFKEPHKFELAETVSRQEGINLDTVKLKDISFEPKRYHKALHLFKIHSWTPFYYNANEIMSMDLDDFSTIVKPGAMVLSQNSLNTAMAQLGWYYEDRHHHGKLDFTYMGWYPVINLNIDYGGEAFDLNWTENEQGDRNLRAINPGRTLIEAEARIYVPFNLSRNHYTRGIRPSLTYYFTNNKYEQYSSGKMDNFQYILPEILFYNYRRMSLRDILPKWGYQLRLQHLSAIGHKDNYGKLYAARLTTYLPGIFRNNSLMLRAGYQYQSVDNKAMYLPEKLLAAPRGTNFNYATHQQIELKADYAFSFLYPDWSLGSLAYFKRLRSNLFYDININKRNKNADWRSVSSAGIDLIVDWNGLQSEFPIATGVRLVKPFEEDGVKAELLFSISF